MKLPYHDKLDALFMQPDEEVSALEQAARICDVATVEAFSIGTALRTSICASNIRSLPGWKPYKYKVEPLHPIAVETMSILNQLAKETGKQPYNFYFHVGLAANYNHEDDAEDEVMVVICSIEFFDSHGYVYDRHLGINHLLPDFMSECGECLFDTTKSVEETRQELLARGFVESENFSEFCDDHDPF